MELLPPLLSHRNAANVRRFTTIVCNPSRSVVSAIVRTKQIAASNRWGKVGAKTAALRLSSAGVDDADVAFEVRLRQGLRDRPASAQEDEPLAHARRVEEFRVCVRFQEAQVTLHTSHMGAWQLGDLISQSPI
jgi:hypothetical protein